MAGLEEAGREREEAREEEEASDDEAEEALLGVARPLSRPRGRAAVAALLVALSAAADRRRRG